MDRVEIRPIARWPGYAVSSNGEVLTCKITGAHGKLSNTWRPLMSYPIKRGGYLEVQLSHGGIRKKERVHVLVAGEFLGARPDGMQVLHADGCPTNNRPSNLRYGTAVENGMDAVRHGRHYRDNKGKLTAEKVRVIKRRLALGETQRSIANDFSIAQMTVSDIKTGKCWSHIDAQCETEGCVRWME